MKISADRFIIRSYRQGDEGPINDLFCRVFGQSRSIEHWYWKYSNNPYGSFFISLALSPDGIIAAHYASYPVKLLYYPSTESPPDESEICQVGDKMTSADFRSVGFGRSSLLARTVKHFRETYRNFSFSYGFVTHHSFRLGLLVLDYRLIEPVLYRKIALSRLQGILAGGSPAESRCEEVFSTDATWTTFFYAVAPHYGHLVKRDSEYLTWRYLRRPDKKYIIISARNTSGLTGWAVFSREGNRIIWGDALFRPGDIASVRSVLGCLARHPDAQGADSLEGWFPQRPGWWNHILDELEFEKGPEPNDLRFCVASLTSDDIPERLARYFYYTMGDSDLF